MAAQALIIDSHEPVPDDNQMPVAVEINMDGGAARDIMNAVATVATNRSVALELNFLGGADNDAHGPGKHHPSHFNRGRGPDGGGCGNEPPRACRQ